MYVQSIYKILEKGKNNCFCYSGIQSDFECNLSHFASKNSTSKSVMVHTDFKDKAAVHRPLLLQYKWKLLKCFDPIAYSYIFFLGLWGLSVEPTQTNQQQKAPMKSGILGLEFVCRQCQASGSDDLVCALLSPGWYRTASLSCSWSGHSSSSSRGWRTLPGICQLGEEKGLGPLHLTT